MAQFVSQDPFNRRRKSIQISKIISFSDLPTVCRIFRKTLKLRNIFIFIFYHTFVCLVFIIFLCQLISLHHANELIPSFIQNAHHLNKMATVSIYKMGTTANLNNIKIAICRLPINLINSFNVYSCII